MDEDITGAVTVANMNDTDADTIKDSEDHTGGASGGNGVEETRTGADRHGRDEVDLMKLIVHKPNPYPGGAVVLTVTPAERVRLWGDSKKKTEIDASVYDPATGVATWSSWGAGGDRTIWVEITTASTTVADVELKLECGTLEPDIVNATGVWATWTASKYATTAWAALAGTVWQTDMDTELQDQIVPFGGTGLRPILGAVWQGTAWAQAANVILMQFTVTPSDVDSKLARVEFDLARSRKNRGWFQTTTDAMPVLDQDGEVPWNVLWEKPNDDPHDDDESDQVNASGRMYVIDAPGFRTPLPVGEDRRLWNKQNFIEFARVRFDGWRPSGNQTQGSRASPNYQWHSEVAAIWDAALSEWRRTTAAEGGNNTLGTVPGHIEIGDMP